MRTRYYIRHGFLLYILFFLTGSVSTFAHELKVGGDYDYPPYTYMGEDGSARGFDIDVLEEIEKVSDLSFSYQLSPWDSVLIRLKKGEIDVITGIIYSEEREGYYDFTIPIHTEYYAIFCRKSSPIKEVGDLEGNRAALLRGDISVKRFIKPRGLLKNAVYVSSLPDAITRVEYGEVDYVIAPYTLGKKTIEENNYSKTVVKGPRLMPSLYCLAVNKGNEVLLARLNRSITTLKETGKLNEIEDKWFVYSRRKERLKKIGNIAAFSGIIALAIILILYAWFKSLRRQVRIKTEQILQAEHKYRELFDSNKDGLIIFSEEGKITDVNPEACKMFGYQYNEMTGMDGKELQSEAHQYLFDEFCITVRKGAHFHAESIEKRKDGTQFHASVKGVKIKSHDQVGLFAVVRDITGKKKTEENLIRAKKMAEAASQAKSNFLSNVSHEIRTPLNAISGYSELLKTKVFDKEQSKYLCNLIEATGTLKGIINNILDFSKLEAGKMTLSRNPFLVSRALQKVENVLSVLAEEKKLAFVVTRDPSVPEHLIGDDMRMKQVLYNLGTNAIKYTESGKVEIFVKQDDTFDQPGKVRLIFEVYDTGPGIPDQHIENIFKPFNQVDNSASRKYEGTGLGLSISRDLVELMGGEISLSSQVGKGSIFRFMLPFELEQLADNTGKNDGFVHSAGSSAGNEICAGIAEDSGQSNMEDEAELTQCIEMLRDSMSHISILVVEDNHFNIEIINDLLVLANCEVEVASSGKEAIRMMDMKKYDAVLMDVQMPDMDGNETTRMLRKNKNHQDIPVIGISAHAMKHDVEKSLAAGMNDYLTKPIKPAQLFQTLYQVINEGIARQKDNIEEKAPLLNINLAVEQYDNNKELYDKAIQLFLKNYQDIPDELIELMESNEWMELKRRLHNLVNAFGVIGAYSLKEEGRNMEEKIKNDYSITQEEFDAFIFKFRNLVDEILSKHLS